MKKLIALLLCVCFLLSGCVQNAVSDDNDSSFTTDVTDNSTEPTDNLIIEDSIPSFVTLDDPNLLQYIQDVSYAGAEKYLASDDYRILSVNVTYLSTEYLKELEYNSKENIFFGFKLSELDEMFQGKRYVFTLGEDGKTVVKELEVISEEDRINKMMLNVAIGVGVIVVCAVIEYFSAGSATPVAVFFAGSATAAMKMALSGMAIGGITAGALEMYQTGEMDTALDSAILAGSEGFKWGAVSGAVTNGISNTLLAHAAKTNKIINNPRDSELLALKKYPGREQVTYLDGKEVAYATPGGTRPDIVMELGNHIEAIEVKNYDLVSNSSLLKSELRRQIFQRLMDLPANSTQRIVLDVTGRGYSRAFVNAKVTEIRMALSDIYQNIPIDVIGL